MKTKKLWGGRFSSEEDPFFNEFNRSLPFDKELLEMDVLGSLAYARALERARVFTHRERLAVEKGLRSVLEDHRRNPGGIATSPARPPFSVMLRSGLPLSIHIMIKALIEAVAAAVFVVTAIWAIEAQSRAMVDPGLNPNHPNHSTNTPMSAEVML